MADENDQLSPDLNMLDVQVWNLYWGDVQRRIGPSFTRSDVRDQAMRYLAGLLSPAERKNSWQLAEICGAANPYGFQHLLGGAIWDADALRDRLRSYITDYLAAPDAVDVIDESGFLKKGDQSTGVARQYSGTAGKIENCQMVLVATAASSRGPSAPLPPPDWACPRFQNACTARPSCFGFIAFRITHGCDHARLPGSMVVDLPQGEVSLGVWL